MHNGGAKIDCMGKSTHDFNGVNETENEEISTDND